MARRCRRAPSARRRERSSACRRRGGVAAPPAVARRANRGHACSSHRMGARVATAGSRPQWDLGPRIPREAPSAPRRARTASRRARGSGRSGGGRSLPARRRRPLPRAARRPPRRLARPGSRSTGSCRPSGADQRRRTAIRPGARTCPPPRLGPPRARDRASPARTAPSPRAPASPFPRTRAREFACLTLRSEPTASPRPAQRASSSSRPCSGSRRRGGGAGRPPRSVLLQALPEQALALVAAAAAVLLHAPEQACDLAVAVLLGVLRVLLEPEDVLEAEVRDRDQVVVLVLGAAFGLAVRHRSFLLVDCRPPLSHRGENPHAATATRSSRAKNAVVNPARVTRPTSGRRARTPPESSWSASMTTIAPPANAWMIAIRLSDAPPSVP